MSNVARKEVAETGLVIEFTTKTTYADDPPAIGDQVELTTTAWEVNIMADTASVLNIGEVVAVSRDCAKVSVRTPYRVMRQVPAEAAITVPGLGVWKNGQVLTATAGHVLELHAAHGMMILETATVETDVVTILEM
jgi:hypothetical protein